MNAIQYTPRTPDPVFDSLEPVALGLGLSLVELSVSRHKGSVRIRAIVYKKGDISLGDCATFHRAAIPRLELAFPGQELYVEVSSPGIDRHIKDGFEFGYYTGHPIRCYRTDSSAWFSGILTAAGEADITLQTPTGTIHLPYEIIAKARLE
jgi:ribosome maturation factor RimP